MDSKITLKFDERVINKAKEYAESQGISLSRLTEFLYQRMTEKEYPNLEELPISNWVNMVAEGEVEYKTRKRAQSKETYYQSKK